MRDMTGDLRGATITGMRVYAYARHWYGQTGVASIGVLRRGASPAGAVLICEEALHVTGDGRLSPGPAVSALRERIGPQVFARTGLDELPGTGERRPV